MSLFRPCPVSIADGITLYVDIADLGHQARDRFHVVPSGRNSRISTVSRPFARRHDAINAIPLNCRGLIRSRYEPLDVLIDLMAAVMSRPDTKCL